jgi:signal peptidase II
MLPWIALVIVLDQISKYLILQSFTFGSRLPVIPGFFDLTLTFNKGAAFGFLAGIEDDTVRHTLLGVSTVVAFGIVLFVLWNDYRADILAQSALGSIVGGAMGNLIDRVRFGAVVDFLDVYVGQYHWPVFNIADSAICIGVALLILRNPLERWFAR